MIAEEERKSIIQRTRDGVQARVQEGRILPSHKPLYGYRWDDSSRRAKNRYIINPEEATIVRRIFEMAKNGISLHGIAKQLTDEGTTSPTGRPLWRYQSVRYILSHPFYTGKASAYRWKNEKLPGMRYQQSRRGEDGEYFGLKALVWRAEHKPQFEIQCNPPDIVSTEEDS